jgi:hypothetical protein
VIGLLLALALNADSIHVADQLSGDGELRGSLSALAQRVNALFPNGQEAPKEVAQAALEEIAPQEAPLARADRLLKEAIARIGCVFWRDDDVARTKFDQWQLDNANKTAVAPSELVMSCARNVAAAKAAAKPAAGSTARADVPKEFLSNPSTWVLVLPAVQSVLHGVEAQPEPAAPTSARQRPPDDAPKNAMLGDLQSCLSLLSGQVRTVAAMRGDATQAGADLFAAAEALDGARAAVHQHVDDRQMRLPMARLFQRDPELFAECAKANPPSQEALRRCLEAGLKGRARLPVFFTQDNRRLQFCQPRTLADADPPAGAFFGAVCGEQTVARDRRLGFPDGLRLIGPDWGTLLLWVFGCLITAVFVALGAPFWFDVLGKVSKVRAAGEVRKPEPPPAPAGSTDPPPGGAKTAVDPFNLARNVVEKAMTLPTSWHCSAAWVWQAPACSTRRRAPPSRRAPRSRAWTPATSCRSSCTNASWGAASPRPWCPGPTAASCGANRTRSRRHWPANCARC